MDVYLCAHTCVKFVAHVDRSADTSLMSMHEENAPARLANKEREMSTRPLNANYLTRVGAVNIFVNGANIRIRRRDIRRCSQSSSRAANKQRLLHLRYINTVCTVNQNKQ